MRCKALALSRKLTSKKHTMILVFEMFRFSRFLIMRDSIIQRFKTYSADLFCKHRKLVIFLKDTTDMLESGGVDGRKVLLGLMDLVLSLRRDHNIPVLFVSAALLHLLAHQMLKKCVFLYFSFRRFCHSYEQGKDNIHSNIWKIKTMNAA
ncbi:hypothetical protein BSLG_005873 [Batrachochytrium salamandrivorans]|nr:hypothetical protein BSLG_005873 [Batrachochytrium salamandrivorans]